ncbi:phosphatase PAP2 family protein [Paenibacillus tundrae]|uniref:Undecaprenyl-diphosphatase n=1 Tax=Paenibacillus tundrae TaxID=528187 RepID=A0ABT9WIS3_9BACL|nr:phosphatase PAP2 family protein [Paenibacillus tundrae]MDQ0173171.1 undecaprenyl-diphosphatase [Paenibacillus tundrae]
MLRNTHSSSSFFTKSSSPLRSLLTWSIVGFVMSSAVVFLLAALALMLGTDFVMHWDHQIQRLFYLHSETRLQLFPFTSFITALGSFKISALAAIGFTFLFFLQRIPRFYFYGYALLGSFAIMWTLNTGLKEIFQRSRPELEHLLVVHGYSFPSGHAMISMGFYGMLFVIWAIERQLRTSRPGIPILCGIIFVTLIGLSRIMLGVHYPSDVFTGFMAGLAWIFCMIPGIRQRS